MKKAATIAAFLLLGHKEGCHIRERVLPVPGFLYRLLSPQGWKWVVLLFLLLVLPGIVAPYHSDDWFQLLLLDEDSVLRRNDGSLWGLFSFIDEVPAHREQMQAFGVLPWFAAEDFSFRFWRPVTEITHWIDYRIFGVNAFPAHIQSVIWFLLLSGIVLALARHTLPDKTQLPWLAVMIFLWDGQHVANIGWIANRNALVAAVFSMLCLYAHMQWRDRGRTGFAILAVCSWILALGSGEIAVGGFGYLLLYALLLDNAGSRKALLSLLPYVLTMLVWLVLYRVMGFGASVSGGLYIDPLHEPLGFLAAIAQRVPVYVSASLLPVPAGFSWVTGLEYGWMSGLYLAVSVLVTAGFLTVSLKMMRQDRVFAFWLLGSIIALLPVCSTMAQDRLALLQTVGMDIAIASLIYPLLAGGIMTKLQYVLRFILLVIHLILSPMHLLAGSIYLYWGANNILSNALQFPDEKIRGKRLLVLQAPIGEVVALAGIREVLGKVNPEQVLWLANDEGSLKLEVISSHELSLEKSSGFSNGFEQAFRSVRKAPFSTDDTIKVGAAEIAVERVNAQGYPDRITVSLSGEGLEQWQVYTYKNLQYREVTLPLKGKQIFQD